MATVTDSRRTHDTPLTNQHLGHLLHLASSPLAPRVGEAARWRQTALMCWSNADLDPNPCPVLLHLVWHSNHPSFADYGFLPRSPGWQANSGRFSCLQTVVIWDKMDLPTFSPRPQITWPCLRSASAWISTNGNSHSLLISCVALFESRIKLWVFIGKILF